MSLDTAADAQLEIAHVLFIDIVGYSKLLTNEQRQLLQQLNGIVRETEPFRAAETAGKLVRLPTGDGMALAFFNSPDAPVRCAMAIGRELKKYPELKLRMGIHSGPVDVVFDVNDRPNVAGAGINMAQRVMDCGDAGHILLSKRSADDLAQYAEWKPQLHDLGEMEVKHGLRLEVVSFYNDEVGNPEPPAKLTRAEQAKQTATKLAARRKRRRVISTGAAVALGVALVVTGTWIWHRRVALASAYKAGAMGALEKSIAVLPFENFDADKENAYFADGVQDDILTDLAKVADLRVISRRSVAQYRGGNQTIRDIGQALQVAYVLEGTVRRLGNKIRITAQLIDTRTEIEKWTEKYDRDIADLFAVQNQISQSIVTQLKATLSPEEKSAIESPPTQDLEAYDLYLRAKSLFYAYGITIHTMEENLPKVEALLHQAIARDPKFVLAYCLLAEVQHTVYVGQPSPEQLASAKATLDTVMKIAPDAGEVHLALGSYLWAADDKVRSIEELEIAARKLPNSVEIVSDFGQLEQMRGQWKESIRDYQKAMQLDPRDPALAQQLAGVYLELRRYGEAEQVLNRAIAGMPAESSGPLWRTKLFCARDRGDLKAAMAAWEGHPLRNAGLGGLNFEVAKVLILQRRYDEAVKLIRSLGDVARAHNVLPKGGVSPVVQGIWDAELGLAERAQHHDTEARAAFESAKQHYLIVLQREPDQAWALAGIATCDAALGHKDEALREIQHAQQVWPRSRDAASATFVAIQAAIVHTWIGDRDAALSMLQAIVPLASGLTPGDLKLNPCWDELRRDPRFAAIIAQATQPVKIE
jgi:TolB-like protein/class 3 adenylate cyclase/Tfp pilus assembly protein PilF